MYWDSNSRGGVTVDLDLLKSVEILGNGNKARVGGDATIVHVYHALESQNLSYVGGRVGSVGISGLKLGAGTSPSSNKYGWASFLPEAPDSDSPGVREAKRVVASATMGASLIWRAAKRAVVAAMAEEAAVDVAGAPAPAAAALPAARAWPSLVVSARLIIISRGLLVCLRLSCFLARLAAFSCFLARRRLAASERFLAVGRSYHIRMLAQPEL
jgi:hypothetical protein